MSQTVIPTPNYKSYSSVNGGVNCRVDDPAKQGRAAMWIYAAGAGTVVLRPPGMGADSSRDDTVTLIAGKDLPLEFEQIVTGTATNVTVFWKRYGQ